MKTIKNIAYWSIVLLLGINIWSEAESIENVKYVQVAVIAGFNIGAAVLFMVAGLMKAENIKGFGVVMAIAMVSRIWTFVHIGILCGLIESSIFEGENVKLFGFVSGLEMAFMNFIIVGSEVILFFVANPKNTT